MTHRIRLAPSGLSYVAADGEPLLDAALGAGLRLRYSCRNGVCELCDAQLCAGRVLNTRTGEWHEAQPGQPETLLLCRLVAGSDCTFDMDGVMPADQIPSRRLACQVTSVDALNHDVYRVLLKPPAGTRLDYLPGQYLAILLPEADPAFFSIASSPGSALLELHVQASELSVSAWQVLTHLRSQSVVNIELPKGRAFIQPELMSQPLVIVASGTGFAQAHSIINAWFKAGASVPLSLFWGARKKADIYLESLPVQWAAESTLFHCEVVVGDDDDSAPVGHRDLLVEAVLASGHDWRNTRVLASGSPLTVYGLMDALMAAGLPADAFLADVLEYAPRS